MNNSQLFKEAHKQARLTVATVGDYQIAFTLALRELIAESKKPVKVVPDFNTEYFVGVLFVIVFIASIVAGVTLSPAYMVVVIILGTLGALVITGVCWVAYTVYVKLMNRSYNVSFAY